MSTSSSSSIPLGLNRGPPSLRSRSTNRSFSSEDCGSVDSVNVVGRIESEEERIVRKRREHEEKTKRNEMMGMDVYRLSASFEEDNSISDLRQRSFLIIHFGYYCDIEDDYFGILPAEFAIAEINLRSGVLDCYSQPFRPVYTMDRPQYHKYNRLIEKSMKDNGYEDPSADISQGHIYGFMSYALGEIMNMGNKATIRTGEPFELYATDEHFSTIRNCIKWIADRTGFAMEYGHHYVLKSLQTLMANLIIKSDKKEVLKPKLQVMEDCRDSLLSTRFADMKEIACQNHRKELLSEKFQMCSKLIVLSWAYTLLDTIPSLYNIKKRKGAHFPDLADY